jgi:flagellar biosynthesis/type III secretory pathway protein FliH
MEPPVYLLKSRSGETLIQGTAEQLAGWFKDQRITSKDELSRKGWVLYENDQAWAHLEAFPEISGPSAHASLRRRQQRNLWILAGASLLAALGLVLIASAQLLPAYDASRQIAESAEAARQAELKEMQAVAAKQRAEAITKSAREETEDHKQKAQEAAQKLADQVGKNAQLLGVVNGLEAQLERIRKTMPIVVRWRESLINKNQVVVVANTSNQTLKLLVSVYDQGGMQTKKQYGLILDPVGLGGSVKESGLGESIAHYFKKGETVEFSYVEKGMSDRFYPVKSTAP